MVESLFKKKEREREGLKDTLTPIWTPEMGKRLATARMSRMMEQNVLAQMLNVSQATISNIEAGKLRVPRDAPFNVRLLETIFGDVLLDYILMGWGSIRMNECRISAEFWKWKHRKQGMIMHGRIRRGRPTDYERSKNVKKN